MWHLRLAAEPGSFYGRARDHSTIFGLDAIQADFHFFYAQERRNSTPNNVAVGLLAIVAAELDGDLVRSLVV